jgi:hypothetical protein
MKDEPKKIDPASSNPPANPITRKLNKILESRIENDKVKSQEKFLNNSQN